MCGHKGELLAMFSVIYFLKNIPCTTNICKQTYSRGPSAMPSQTLKTGRERQTGLISCQGKLTYGREVEVMGEIAISET